MIIVELSTILMEKIQMEIPLEMPAITANLFITLIRLTHYYTNNTLGFYVLCVCYYRGIQMKMVLEMDVTLIQIMTKTVYKMADWMAASETLITAKTSPMLINLTRTMMA